MEIVIDFDGTCVKHAFPNIGEDIGAAPVLKALVAAGHKLILFTMRSDMETVETDHPDIHPEASDYLTQAVRWFEKNDIPLYGIQTNPTQGTWTSSPKAYGQLIIDDAALGCPLVRPEGERPYVDWGFVVWELGKIGALTMFEVERIFRKHPFPNQSQKADAFCPQCDAYIVNERVTYNECCDTCGTKIEWHDE